MKRNLFLLIGAMLLWNMGFTQSSRTFNGSTNNRQHIDWGSINTQLPRLVSTVYGDGISTPAGTNRPNPRVISNEIFAQDGLLDNPGKLSDYTWVFGQLIDHDVIAVSNNATEPAMIPVNFIDPVFNPTGGLQVAIPMSRSKTFPGSGTSTMNPRQHFNEVTAWLDASAVYGSDLRRAAWLRTGQGGKLKTSAGNLLPFNTIDGELSSDIDPDAPHMDNENPFNQKLFVAGDIRANENPLLTSFHTLFVREHNRLCDELQLAHPDWDDEELYQEARRWVGAIFQVIVFKEWLPVMGINLPSYQGYDPSVNPNISNIFSAAAFRLGHTLLNGNIMRLDEQGEVLPEGNLTLRQAFFNPLIVMETGLDPLFKGMAVQVMQDMDSKVVDDVRNFLFGAPGSGLGGLDLAAININRGRERGIPDFNTIRTDLGLSPYTTFSALCSKPEVADKLEELYGDINNIDAWVGMLAEDHMPDVLFGEVILTIMMQQFQALRDGDRYYYENDPAFSPDDLAVIESTRMHDLIMRNTNVSVMQDSVFIAKAHPLACVANSAYLPVSGEVYTEDGQGIGGVALSIDGYSNPLSGAETENDGSFAISDVPACYEYTLTPEKDGPARNGVSTFDLILIAKHITGQDTLDSPYKMIAADVNNSKTITTFDIIELRKLILFVNNTFPDNEAWRFMPADFQFADPANPLAEVFPEVLVLPELTDGVHAGFLGIKIGDVNNSADTDGLDGAGSGEQRSVTGSYLLRTSEKYLTTEEAHLIPFYGDKKAAIGFQFGLQFPKEGLEVLEIIPNTDLGITVDNFALFAENGLLTASWNGDVFVANNAPLFYLQVRAKEPMNLSEAFSLLHPQQFSSEAYDAQLNLLDLQLEFESSLAQDQIILFQNQPNPFDQMTSFGFQLPAQLSATIQVFDVTGKILLQEHKLFTEGYHEVELDESIFPGSGVYFYQLKTDRQILTKKMVRK